LDDIDRARRSGTAQQTARSVAKEHFRQSPVNALQKRGGIVGTDKTSERFSPAAEPSDEKWKSLGMATVVIVVSVLAITAFLIYSVLMLYAIMTVF
jgi:hypothetical protein